MRDPLEGVADDGSIRTGVARERVPASYEPVLTAASEALRSIVDRGAATPDAELLLYGSVATGQAVPGRSDVDLVMVGADAEAVRPVADELSDRFANLCRAVEIGTAGLADHERGGDEAYGWRVFLRHYCVAIAGPDRVRGTEDFPADARAARGFNGDIGRALDAWRRSGGATVSGRRVARKTLLAVAGIVSVVDRTWTTDRLTAATRWRVHRPELADRLDELVSWIDVDADAVPPADVERALSDVVPTVVDDFRAAVGLWDEEPAAV
jgi:uncharacterized protein